MPMLQMKKLLARKYPHLTKRLQGYRKRSKGGLILPSLPVIKIVKATEVVFQNRITDKGIGITIERNLWLKI